MPLRYTNRILDHLAHTTYEPVTGDEIAARMQVDEEDRSAFRQAVERLQAEQKIVAGPGQRLMLPEMPEEITGAFRLNARGFGFVLPDQPYREGDLFVPRGAVRDAISGDRVRCEVRRQPGRKRTYPARSEVVGRVLEVIERGQEQFVGKLFKRGKEWFVEPDGRSLHDPVLVRDPHARNAKPGDKVVIELLHYPDEEYHAEGVITRVLGEAGRPDVETQAVIEAHGLRTEFPEEVSKQALKAARSFDHRKYLDSPEREDLTDVFTFTIDPPDARDFDDAITISSDEAKGHWTLGIHIADVSEFVRLESDLDTEAQSRGNSVYLPRLVIPMLPEALSNGVCSLQEGVPRLTKSVFITLDGNAKVVGERAASTIIRSNKRLTYIEAQALIEGDSKKAAEHAKAEPEYSDELIDALRLSDRLAKIIRKRRFRDGMIVLNLPEVELLFDEEGHVIDAHPEDDSFTHTIIEMFMVEANEAIARIFDSMGVPVLRRIHPDPSFGDMEELRLYARASKQHLPDEPTREDLQQLLEATRETAAARAIHFAVVRTLSKASYSPAMIGHFALASDHYAHFTSPIRRYPDLSVHRTLQAYLDRTDNGRKHPRKEARRKFGRKLMEDERVRDEGELLTLGRHCSDTEREAELAERELRDFLVMQFLQEHHLGSEFPGVVTGLLSSSVFVSIERFLVEGRVSMDEMPQSDGKPDRWKMDRSSARLVAQRSGASIGIGDIVTVQVVRVDLASRHLDLMITKLPQRTAHDFQGDGEVEHPKRKPKKSGKGKPQDKGRSEGKQKVKTRSRRR